MKKHISQFRGMTDRVSAFVQSITQWLKAIFSRIQGFFQRKDFREKLHNSRLSWEERLLLMGLVIVAGILLLGIKLYENHRSNQAAYAELDKTRAVLLVSGQLRDEIHEQLKSSPSSLATQKFKQQLELIQSSRIHSAIQQNRIRNIRYKLEHWQASAHWSVTDQQFVLNLLDGFIKEEQRSLESRRADIELGNSIDQRLFIMLLVTLVTLILFAGYVLYKNQLAMEQARNQLENNRQILQSIIDNSSTMVYVKDMLGRFIFTNKKFTELFGEAGEFLDETQDEIVLATRKTVELQETMEIGLHTVHFYSIRFPLLNKNSQVYATAGILTDISALIRKQEESKEKEILHHTLQTQEHERMEIGMELHDNITQLLASAKMMLDTAIRETSRKDEHLEKARADVFTAIHEARKLSHSLVVPGLENESLTDAIIRLLEGIKMDNRILVQLKMVAQKKLNGLDPSIRLAVYRILQEQVNNILKHAAASQVLVELRYVADSLQLLIQDDGVGFDPNKSKHGIGLTNINRRVRHLGGDCRLHSVPGEGCQLKILIPL